jgi:hypothetical protein
MGLYRKGEYDYSDSQADIRSALVQYSRDTDYVTEHYADAICICGGRLFELLLDEEEGAALRICQTCTHAHAICDSADYLDDADLEKCECLCGCQAFQITVGLTTFPDSDDTHWIFLGCRCPSCGLTGCYGDWKMEASSYKEMLKRV